MKLSKFPALSEFPIGEFCKTRVAVTVPVQSRVQVPVKLKLVRVTAFAVFGCRKNIEKTATMTKAVIFRIVASLKSFDQAAAFRFLRQPSRTNPTRPETKSGRAPGSGTCEKVAEVDKTRKLVV